jgi:hypothetical protein
MKIESTLKIPGRRNGVRIRKYKDGNQDEIPKMEIMKCLDEIRTMPYHATVASCLGRLAGSETGSSTLRAELAALMLSAAIVPGYSGASGMFATPANATISCLPLCPGFQNYLHDLFGLQLAGLDKDGERARVENFVLFVTFAQGVIALMRVGNGELYTGAYSLLLSTLGMNARLPGPGANLMKTFILINSISATMQGLDTFQNAFLMDVAYLSPLYSNSVNIMHACNLASPILAGLASWAGWQLVQFDQHKLKEEYDRRVAAYQFQMQQLALGPPPGMRPLARTQPRPSTARPGNAQFPPTIPEGNEQDESEGTSNQ